MTAPTLPAAPAASPTPPPAPTPAPTPQPTRSAHVTRLLPPVRRAWWRDAVAGTVAAHGLVVTALWATAGGPAALLGGTAAALGSVGRLAGLWSSALLLLQVLGMARIPWAERAVGQDRLVRWHRWAGFTSFWLLGVHLGTLLVSSATAGGKGLVAEAVSMVLTLPGMLLATAGTALLVLVVVTSARAARRRLRYESWHLLHLYAYLGAGLAVPHQLWTGTSFVDRPWAAAYWWGLWGAAAVAVLVWRVAVPLAVSRRHGFRVASAVPDGHGLLTVTVTGRDLARLRAEAGQFFVWRFRTGAGWTRGHPLSLSGQPTTAGLRVTVDLRGDDGARLAALRPGTPVLVEGPYGRTTTSTRTRRRIAAFAAGAGAAPLVGLLQDNAYEPGADTLVLRSRTPEHVPLRADTRWLVDHTGLRLVELPGPRSRTGTPWLPAEHGHVPGPEAVRRLVPDLPAHDVVVCGPPAWCRAVVADVLAAGADPSTVHVESYSW